MKGRLSLRRARGLYALLATAIVAGSEEAAWRSQHGRTRSLTDVVLPNITLQRTGGSRCSPTGR
jgi:hypothetical protein